MEANRGQIEFSLVDLGICVHLEMRQVVVGGRACTKVSSICLSEYPWQLLLRPRTAPVEWPHLNRSR